MNPRNGKGKQNRGREADMRATPPPADGGGEEQEASGGEDEEEETDAPDADAGEGDDADDENVYKSLLDELNEELKASEDDELPALERNDNAAPAPAAAPEREDGPVATYDATDFAKAVGDRLKKEREQHRKTLAKASEALAASGRRTDRLSKALAAERERNDAFEGRLQEIEDRQVSRRGPKGALNIFDPPGPNDKGGFAKAMTPQEYNKRGMELTAKAVRMVVAGEADPILPQMISLSVQRMEPLSVHIPGHVLEALQNFKG
jgi:hypothetical protein